MGRGRPIRELLAEPVFRRIWLVGIFGGVARWLELLVVGIFAFEVTASPFLVALLVILRMLPLAVFGPLVGTLADRWPARLFLLASLSLATLTAGTMLALFVFELAQYWHVALASFVGGLVWTTDMPLRRRLLGDAAGPDRLVPAMGLDIASGNATRMLGPLLGGLLYQVLGSIGAFALIAGLTLICLLLIFGVPAGDSANEPGPATRVLREFREAFAFVARDGERDVLRILLVTVVFNIWGFPFISMIPVIGKDDLALEAGWIGGLAALEGGGAFLGALVIAVAGRALNLRALYYFGTMGFLCFVFAAGWMTEPWPTAVMLFCVGLAGAGFTTMQSTLIYSVAPPHMRGRMFGLLVLCIGSGLIGFSNVGLMGEWFGGSTAIRIIAAEGLVPLMLIALGWRKLWRG
ncbi:MAG: MFS transporter [Alphaproteobacteria bacterium]|jgi:MFS family permease|nr:MFS transporter [Alphaproteobacteria bacterium]HJP21432.1 MFS transporter [Alphaproteobacteria bacterium]